MSNITGGGAINNLYKNCLLCPRRCGVDRTVFGKKPYGGNHAAETGFCGAGAKLYAASASIHRGEEPPVSGEGGSGTIFISGCNLRCLFCQNYQISQNGLGAVVSPDIFTAICIALQERGAENINIVTGSHCVPSIVSAIQNAKTGGLSIPVLWTSSAYENVDTIMLLNDYIDNYLPDLKTLDANIAKKFFNAEDYPYYAAAAIKQMMTDKPGGVIIRHLVLPGYLDSTRAVLRWFADNAAGKAELSLMTQYTPIYNDSEGRGAAPGGFVSRREYDTVLSWLNEFGIEDGYYQELEADSGWLPDFNNTNPFPSALSVPVWHWKTGFIPKNS
jgi:putative pyruvate formate lyase activating enzyme